MTQAACLKSMVMSKKFILVRRKMKTKPNYSLLILEIKRGLNMEEKKKKQDNKEKNKPPLFPERELCHTLDIQPHSESIMRTHA